ncbi:hypothetical protein DFH06DRAFT_1129058 [Mycena polygramma]|nr:hypothetical protein DFH06DRAFT_1129058 [Mycena polygramma]
MSRRDAEMRGYGRRCGGQCERMMLRPKYAMRKMREDSTVNAPANTPAPASASGTNGTPRPALPITRAAAFDVVAAELEGGAVALALPETDPPALPLALLELTAEVGVNDAKLTLVGVAAAAQNRSTKASAEGTSEGQPTGAAEAPAAGMGTKAGWCRRDGEEHRSRSAALLLGVPMLLLLAPLPLGLSPLLLDDADAADLEDDCALAPSASINPMPYLAQRCGGSSQDARGKFGEHKGGKEEGEKRRDPIGTAWQTGLYSVPLGLDRHDWEAAMAGRFLYATLVDCLCICSVPLLSGRFFCIAAQSFTHSLATGLSLNQTPSEFAAFHRSLNLSPLCFSPLATLLRADCLKFLRRNLASLLVLVRAKKKAALRLLNSWA